MRGCEAQEMQMAGQRGEPGAEEKSWKKKKKKKKKIKRRRRRRRMKLLHKCRPAFAAAAP